jgi:hypothetical protein
VLWRRFKGSLSELLKVLKQHQTERLCVIEFMRPRSKLSERTLPFIVVCMRHACCCSASSGAQQSAISTDVVLAIHSACQTHVLSQSTSRARTVTYACAMEHMPGTVLKTTSLFCAPYKAYSLESISLCSQPVV